MKIAITGHRPNKLGNDYDLTSNLIRDIENRISEIILKYYPENGTRPTLITGMALGIDTLFAKMAIRLNINFIAAIPFRGQHSKWVSKSVNTYMNLLTKADKVYLVDEEVYLGSIEPSVFHEWLRPNNYSPEKLQLRNQWMVDNCDLLIAVWDKSSGGTANCVKYAQSINKEIIFINPNDYKEIRKGSLKPL